MTQDNTAPLDVVEVVNAIGSMVERVITAGNEAELLGPELHRLRTDHRLPPRMVIIGALLNDFARVAHSCIMADEEVSDEELEQVYPIFFPLLSFLAKIRAEYEPFVGFGQDEMRELLAHYAGDARPFGARASNTQWVGLDVCRRTARATGDEEPLDLYVRSQQRLMERILDLGGLTPAESATRARLGELMELRRRLDEEPLPQSADPRLTAFCDPNGPPVFSAIAHAHQVWERDPFDVESVHAEARETFERLVDRVTAIDADARGRILVLRGPSGAGKTHLMRAFRGYLHGQRLGFAAYMQMTTRSDDYARYVLVNLIDALERPYDPPEVTSSGLITLSDALVEDRRALSPDDLEDLREGEFDLARNDTVSPLVDRLLGQAEYESFDPDFLRVLLYLQRREPRIRARVLKYLRCEHLNDYDCRMLGGIAPLRDRDAPLRMVEQFGRLMSKLRRQALVLLIDQMEDVFNLDEAGLRVARSVDVLRHVVDHVPTAVVVLSCLHDFYDQVRRHLTRSALDRLESDPPPITLSAGRSLDDIQQIVGLRLEHLYDKADVRWHDDDPTYPIRVKDLESLANMRTRDVLDWCRTFQERCIEEGSLSEPPVGSPAPQTSAPSDVTQLEQAWNDFRTAFAEEVPEDDDALIELLEWAATRVGHEFAPSFELATRREGSALVVTDANRPLVVGICNRSARGGALHKQLETLKKIAKDRPVGIVRCSEYPANPRTLVYQLLGKLLSAGGRRVTVEDGDWRTIRAFQAFAERHRETPGFARWRRDERPLSQLTSLRALFALDERQPEPATIADAPVPTPAPVPARAARESTPTRKVPVSRPAAPPPTPAPTRAAMLRVGRTAGLTPEAVAIELEGLTTHAAFLGSTGSGKTTLALNLIEQALEHDIPVLMLDRKGDLCTYARAAWWATPGRDGPSSDRKQTLANRVRVAVFTPGAPDGRDLGLTVVPTGLADLSAHERAQTCRQAAAALGTMLGYRSTSSDLACQSVLAKALEVLGQVVREGDEVKLEQVISLIADEDPALVNAVGRLDTKHFRKLVDHLETLRLSKGDLLSARAERLDPVRLLGLGRTDGKTQLAIVSTKFLGDNASIDFWVARMLSELARWASRNPSPRLQALVMFDEADIYMPAQRKPATKEPMQDLLRRARSAGLGVLLATQSPGDLDYKSRDNIRTWFLGRVAENTAIAKMQPLLSESRTNVKGKLARQSIGEFFMLQGGKLTELKADRSLMDTEQLAEDEIRDLARTGTHES